MCREHGMIAPFEEKLVREIDGRRIISAGVSSYGYDLRLAEDGFRVFSPIASAEIDPKRFDENSLIEAPVRTDNDGAKYWLLPPHSYALGVTVETFNMPRRVIGICMGKCLPGDTKVMDASTGEMVELRTFVEEKRKTIGTLAGQCISAGRVDRHVYSGVKPTFELRTGTGRVIRATERHPFLTFGGNALSQWTELRELRPGDRVGVSGIGQSHILWDTIAAITPVGEEPVYDLSVAHTHNFIANDFIVHNSTYARSGLIVNTTPLEPGWRGRLVLEFSNSADLPIRIYANEGIAQVTFFESDEDCDVSYADRVGKYQDQPGLVTPRL
jgi:deoxycytidine triphosphate deaminase